MMEIFISTLPGISLSCAFFLLMLAGVQGRIYFTKGYDRSKAIMIFCLLSVISCVNHFINQSRVFSDEISLLSVYIALVAILAIPIFYLKSVSYFIAVSNRFFSIYTKVFALLTITAAGSLVYFVFTGEDIYFNSDISIQTHNFFADTYTARYGGTRQLLTVMLAQGSSLTLIGSLILLKTVMKSSRDWYFICGLLFTAFCELRENILLPWTVDHYVPFVFMANLFEAFRMNSFSYHEYMKEKHHALENTVPEKEKYQNSNLTEERIKELASRISQVLQDEKLYINPNLNSEDLAKKIGIPTYQLSQVVNIGLNTTFFELLSQCRIEEVKRRFEALEFKSETIINIAYASGFNSKSAFNTAFKKRTGMTPSAYRKQIGEAP